MKGPSCRSKGVVLLKQVMVNHEGRSPSIFKAHEITRNNQMFSVSSFLLIISVKGGKKKKHFSDVAKGTSMVQFGFLCRHFTSRELLIYERHLPQDSFGGFLHFAC